jgi:hypothetical protein
MHLSRILATSAILISLVVAVPAHAQRGGGRRGGAVVGRAVPRAGAPRTMAPRPIFAPRGMVAPRFIAPRVSGPRTFGLTPRPFFASRGVIPARAIAVRRTFVPRVFTPRLIGPRIVVSRFRFARPFFVFRPRFSLAVGLWAGFPVAYPYVHASPYQYAYPYPYSYPYPYPASGYYGSAYGYPSYPASSYPAAAPGTVGVQPGQNYSGVSFDITPNTAEVYVDGTYIGTVAEFSPTSMPLTLTPGRHHFEVRAAGYQTMAFDADIVAGQVIPYRGEMQPIR